MELEGEGFGPPLATKGESMARNIDLTGKLGMGERPTITVGDMTLTVDDSAPNIIRVMEIVGDGNMTPAAVVEAADLLFEEKSRKQLAKLGLSLGDYGTLVEAATELVMGDEGEGEGETPATT